MKGCRGGLLALPAKVDRSRIEPVDPVCQGIVYHFVDLLLVNLTVGALDYGPAHASEAEKSRSELETAKAEAEKARTELEAAKAEAAAAKAETEVVREKAHKIAAAAKAAVARAKAEAQ